MSHEDVGVWGREDSSHEDMREQRHLRQREQHERGPKKGICPVSLRKETWEAEVERNDLKMIG